MGFAPLREWLAGWQGVEVEQVLVGNGSLQLIDFLCLTILQPGDMVLTESPTYDRTLTLLRRHKARIVGIPLEPDGPDIAALEAALKRRTPKFFYVIPDFQNPSGTTCSGEKRRRIAEFAQRYDFLLLEDAPYRPLRYHGRDEPTLFNLASDRTLHLSSFSKLIGPGPRVGFMLGNAGLLARMAQVAEDPYISPNYLAHGITYEWCRRGLLPAQIVRLRDVYAPRLEACLAALDNHMPDARPTRPEGGFFVSVTMPAGVPSAEVRAAASRRNLTLADVLALFPNGGGDRFMRLPYCALTPADINEGVRRLAETVKEVYGRAVSPAFAPNPISRGAPTLLDGHQTTME
jgi:DNA-binding transcriptional MocR family regulator